MNEPQAWSFVGRVQEFDQILGARRAGRSVVITGPAGVGKSRLIRETLDRVARDGAVTGWVQATRSSARIPLGAFASLLPADVVAEGSFELMRRAIDALRARARGNPIVLAVDDAQWLDPTSAALVLMLTTEKIAFVAATLRTGEEHPDAVAALWKDAGALRIDLDHLNPSQTTQLAEAILGGPLDRRTGSWVWTLSQGNALYVRELVRGAKTGGILRATGGLWHLTAPILINASLTELISARLIGLDADELSAAELLAVGEQLRLAEFTEAAGEDAVVALEARGLLTVSEGSGPRVIQLSHPLYGEVIRSSIPPLRSQLICRRLLAIIGARTSRSRDDVLRLARWSLDSDTDMDADLLVEAATAALRSGDPDLGGILADKAIRQGNPLAGLLLARSHLLRRQFAQAQAALNGLEEDAREHRIAATEYLEQQSEILQWALNQPAELRTVLDRAATWWSDQDWQDRIGSLRLRLASFERLGQGNHQHARVEHGDDHGPEGEAADIGNLLYAGQVIEAQRLAERLRPDVPLRGLGDALALSLWSRTILESGIGWDEFQTKLKVILNAGIATGDHAAVGQAAYSLASLSIAAGRFLTAHTLLAESEIHLNHHDPLALLPVISAAQAEVACFLGNPNDATALLDKCRQQLNGAVPLPHQLPYVLRAEAWIAHTSGYPERAQEVLLDGASQLSGSTVHIARMTYEALRAGASPAPLVSTLVTMTNATDSRLIAAYAAHAVARVDGDPVSLLRVVDEFESIGAGRYAAEAAAHAAGLYAHGGRDASARSAAARSRDLTPAGEGGTSPTIVELDAAAITLTAREAQMSRLAAQGMSNAEIAQELVLSVRTVESHLYRAMSKLGVTDRRALRR